MAQTGRAATSTNARFGTLQEQARGALLAHAQVSVEPPARMLDDLAAFQQTLFSSPGVELLADAILSGTTPFPDPDPELDQLEQARQGSLQSRLRTMPWRYAAPERVNTKRRSCVPFVRFTTSRPACPRPALMATRHVQRAGSKRAPIPIRTLRMAPFQFVTSLGPGATATYGPTPPGLDVTSLNWGISKTAPYFHNNSAATLEEVLDHYDAFFRPRGRLNPPPNCRRCFTRSGAAYRHGIVRKRD